MRITVRGIVQGVGFRPTVHRVALRLGMHGYVQNNGSNVVIEVDGDADHFISELRRALPPLARLDSVDVCRGLPDGELAGMGFQIIKSSTGQKGVGIPNDTAICENCIKEMSDRNDRRHRYPFTNCTDCGARFSIIRDLPYDRELTSMDRFPMCPDCRREYEDPAARRFHHQTISCPVCGPRFRLLDGEGKKVTGEPIATFATLLEQGLIGVAKGWGGMHLCCTLATLPRMRQWYRRREKPFAMMVRDMEAVRRYAMPDQHDERLLTSPHRPIVLLPKIETEVTEQVAPGLGNIGVFLPYTEMHHMLFSELKDDALVMTSANVPGEPMVLRDEDAMALGADCYLFHDREIVNRCDDSVVRSFENGTFYIRKSRGHIPVAVDFPFDGTAIGLGAQESIAGALAAGRRLYATQYIGDASSAGVLEFLESGLAYQRRLLGADNIDAIGIDLHPGFSTRRLGKRLAEGSDVRLVEVQHHWAHAAALMVDRHIDESVVLTLDGTGYGDDGNAWGGEVLHSRFDSYHRAGHLQEIPLLGGEKAVYDVKRLVFAIREMLGQDGGYYTDVDSALLRKLMEKSPRTTSMGRVMDALSCYLGICQYRSYDGEPAMKLERWLEKGRPTVELAAEVRNGVVQTVPLFAQLFGSEGKKEDLAVSFVKAVLESLVDIACLEADAKGLSSIGLTGGVSYNATVCRLTKEIARSKGFELMLPDQLPNGDGCISAGQCAIALSDSLE
jgi:hydrogenase maturation protein HypF